jgi:exopolysaccharide biosynthesis polyprenyl glycosylphosphotransferase
MLRQFSIKRILGFAVLDWLGTLGMLLLAAYLRAWLGNIPGPVVELARSLQIPIRTWEVNAASDTLTPQVFFLVSVIWPFFFIVFHVYDGRYNETLKAELLNVLLALIASSLALAGLLYFTYQETSRVVFLTFSVLDILLLSSTRILWWSYRRSSNRTNHSVDHVVLIVGAGPVGQHAASELRKYARSRVSLIGFVDDDPDKQNMYIEDLPVLGSLEQIPDIIDRYQVQDAVVALPLRAHLRLVNVCRTLQQRSVRVHVIPDLFALSFPSATLDGFGGIPVIDLGRPGIYGWRRLAKRVFDVAVTTVILGVVWPLMLLIAALIKLDSPGPVLFRQKRIGENGQPFYMLKFRSMKTDSDEKLHREHVTRLIKENVSLADHSDRGSSLKMTHDPRITRVGRFIRKTSLDELPQLINVLKGEMSLVGPRPPIPYEVELYQEWHKRRLEAIPGVTGLWQVKGRNKVSFDEMVRMDIDYIEHQSLWLDVKLLFLTPFALLSGQGAG